MGSKLIADAVSKSRRVLFVVHRQNLVSQTTSTLERIGITAGVIWSDYPANPDAPVQIAMLQSLQNRELPKDIGLVIVDECHTTAYYSIIKKVFDVYSGNILALSKTFFVGLTATPWRSKRKEGYCHLFQAIVRGPSPDDLIRQGHLAFARSFGWGGMVDFSQLETGSHGDFTASSIAKVCGSDFNQKEPM